MKDISLILLVLLFCSCEKSVSPEDSPIESPSDEISSIAATDKPPSDVSTDGPLTLMGQVTGTYEGIRFRKNESINCPTCAPPCDFNYAYDTSYVFLIVDSVGENLISVSDTSTWWFDIDIPIDSTLYYEVPPPVAPDGSVKFWFVLEEPNSLVIDIFQGGGDACGGFYQYFEYDLEKQ